MRFEALMAQREAAVFEGDRDSLSQKKSLDEARDEIAKLKNLLDATEATKQEL